jgi:hypothetical protein
MQCHQPALGDHHGRAEGGDEDGDGEDGGEEDPPEEVGGTGQNRAPVTAANARTSIAALRLKAA